MSAAENIFIFGLSAEEVDARRRRGLDASDAIAASPELAAALDAIADGAFSPDDPDRFRHIADRVRYVDPYMIAADFAAYRAAQAEVEALWRSPAPGAAPPRSISRGWAGSPPTGRSPNMPPTSGTCRSRIAEPDEPALGAANLHISGIYLITAVCGLVDAGRYFPCHRNAGAVLTTWIGPVAPLALAFALF